MRSREALTRVRATGARRLERQEGRSYLDSLAPGLCGDVR